MQQTLQSNNLFQQHPPPEWICSSFNPRKGCISISVLSSQVYAAQNVSCCYKIFLAVGGGQKWYHFHSRGWANNNCGNDTFSGNPDAKLYHPFTPDSLTVEWFCFLGNQNIAVLHLNGGTHDHAPAVSFFSTCMLLFHFRSLVAETSWLPCALQTRFAAPLLLWESCCKLCNCLLHFREWMTGQHIEFIF